MDFVWTGIAIDGDSQGQDKLSDCQGSALADLYQEGPETISDWTLGWDGDGWPHPFWTFLWGALCQRLQTPELNSPMAYASHLPLDFGELFP